MFTNTKQYVVVNDSSAFFPCIFSRSDLIYDIRVFCRRVTFTSKPDCLLNQWFSVTHGFSGSTS